jgi:hypothetical protein
MLDPRKDRQTGLLQHRPSVVVGTCPVVVVLVGSTWAVVAARTVPVVGRSPVLAAGMGWGSRSNCCQALVGCSSLGGPSVGRVGHHHSERLGGTRAVRLVVRPMMMSANVHARCATALRDDVAQHGVEMRCADNARAENSRISETLWW